VGKIFAVGDIHGCFEKLETLMGILDINPGQDVLVFVGDYIDRGPRSKDVVSYLIELGGRHDHVVFLKGNHEFLLERYLKGTESHMFLANGGDATLDSYMRAGGGLGDQIIPPDHRTFFDSLRYYYQTDDYIFVHAGLKPGITLKRQKESDLLWIRDEFIYSDVDFGRQVVFGHTPFREPLILNNKIGIDTGAVYGNKLTCVELPAMKFFSV
jgi:serine/threonine protein phosphatase 1